MQQPQVPSDPLLEGTFETVFPIAFAVVAGLVLLGFVAVGWLFLRNARAARRAGLAPFSPEADVLGRLAQSRLLAPAASLESRLHELDDLRRRGVISDDEHRAARARALAGG